MHEVVIHTDGSVSGNGKPEAYGGWAAILQALQVDDTTECPKCNYKGDLSKFKDTEYDGDVLGTCPKCRKNGVLIIDEIKIIVVAEKEISGKMTYETHRCPVTNNRAEMMAILQGLKEILKPCHITVYSDSELCIKTLNGIYDQKSNLDLWEMIDLTVKGLKATGSTLEFRWEKGHADNELNKRADKLAGAAKKG